MHTAAAQRGMDYSEPTILEFCQNSLWKFSEKFSEQWNGIEMKLIPYFRNISKVEFILQVQIFLGRQYAYRHLQLLQL